MKIFEHDYKTKENKKISFEDIMISSAGEKILWISVSSEEELDKLKEIDMIKDHINTLKDDQISVRNINLEIFRFDFPYILFKDWIKNNKFDVRNVRCLLGSRFLITYCEEEDDKLLKKLFRGYVTDFSTASKVAVFIIYEMFHHTIESYVKIHRVLQKRLKEIDNKVTKSKDEIIEKASELHSNMLDLREITHASRNILNHLASRVSLHISATTKPYLDNMSMVLERLDDDLVADRQVISDTVSFHVSLISYKMNIQIKTMTAVNVIFVPLTFWAAVYGMNFTTMPEYHWKYGYHLFWLLSFMTLVVSVYWLRKQTK